MFLAFVFVAVFRECAIGLSCAIGVGVLADSAL